jgi:hypothetical protein
VPRYYDLTLTKPSGAVATRTNGTPYRWGTNISGSYDPSALNITFDCVTTYMAQPTDASTITLEGISLEDVQQGSQFAGLNLSLSGGMTAGLPLANPAQKGVILKGTIWQSWANWVGTEQALTFVVRATPYTITQPGNFSLSWKKGQALSSALAATFTSALPNLSQNISISSDLIASQDMPGHYPTLESFAAAIKKANAGSADAGVDIWISQGTIFASDQSSSSTSSSSTTTLNFQDLIGQPSWIGQNLIQITTVLRADIGVGSSVLFPKARNAKGQLVTIPGAPGFVTSAQAALPSSLKYSTTMSGAFQIQAARHIGVSRSADGTQWASIFNAFPTATSNELS